MRVLQRGLARSALRERLRALLGDWDGLLAENMAEARSLLTVALADRIQFTPVADGKACELGVPIAFYRVMAVVVPEFVGLQDRLASPKGRARLLTRKCVVELEAA